MFFFFMEKTCFCMQKIINRNDIIEMSSEILYETNERRKSAYSFRGDTKGTIK